MNAAKQKECVVEYTKKVDVAISWLLCLCNIYSEWGRALNIGTMHAPFHRTKEMLYKVVYNNLRRISQPL